MKEYMKQLHLYICYSNIRNNNYKTLLITSLITVFKRYYIILNSSGKELSKMRGSAIKNNILIAAEKRYLK